MGTQRIGNLPRTKKWREVIELIAGGAGAAQIASITIRAAETGLERASKDEGFVATIRLLMQLPHAARAEDFRQALRELGLDVSATPTLFEIVGAFSDALDRRLIGKGHRTDLGEIAQLAAAETINKVIGPRVESLFETSTADVQRELGRLTTAHQFGIFARHFFARVTDRYLDYFLSRALRHQVGEAKRFATLAGQAEFSKALQLYCEETSHIVEVFSGEWLSKTRWEQGEIDRRQAGVFAHVAVKKIVSAFKQEVGSHAG